MRRTMAIPPEALPQALLPLVVLLSYALLSSAADVLQLGASPLKPSSPPLISASGTFRLSFRPFSADSSSSSLYLAISFSFSLDSSPAWVANRDRPVSSSASLSLSSDGSLTLSDPSGVVWSSGSSRSDVVRAQLLNSGNLVLLDSSSHTIWQSFDFPTDTLLPGQRFGRNSKLLSRSRSDDFASGRYALSLNSNGVVSLTYTSDDAADYWSWPGSTAQTTFLQYDQKGAFSFDQSAGAVKSSIVPTDYGSSRTRRLTLDMDGNLRMYSWNEASSQWIRVWLAFPDQCTRVRTLCGNYGICILDPDPVCICPPGFSVVDMNDLSSGCRSNLPLDRTSRVYVPLESTNFPFNDYYNKTNMKEADCKTQCSLHPNCLAAVYGQTDSGSGHCWLKSQVLNGVGLQSQSSRSFLKVSGLYQSALAPISDSGTHWSSDTVWQGTSAGANKSCKTIITWLAVVIGAQLLGFTAVLACLIRRMTQKVQYMKLHADLEEVSGAPIMFSKQELKVATNNFCNTLGRGGFGIVYKGQLANGKLVAVKRLEGLSHREGQFRAEIATIGKIHHMNLLRLVGFCAKGDHRLLVYEYMENGSLDELLFQPSSDTVLDWDTRFQICLEVARGIAYLHEECLDCILHCDIKPQNILLDKNYCAKVADFGLAYLYSREHSVKVSTIRGTRGYLAPEWVLNLPITEKADVFSYGMLLFEIVSGRSNYLHSESAMREENEKWCFPAWAYERTVEEVVDQRMGNEVIYGEVETVMKVAFCCVQADMNARPSMGKVVQMLEGTLVIPETPSPSLFFEGAYSQNASKHTFCLESSSSSSIGSSLSSAKSRSIHRL